MRSVVLILLVTVIVKCRSHTLRNRYSGNYGLGSPGGFTYEVVEVEDINKTPLAGLTKPGEVVIVEVVEETSPQQNQRPAYNPAFANQPQNQAVSQTMGQSNNYYHQTSWHSGYSGNNGYNFGQYNPGRPYNENNFGAHGFNRPPSNSNYYPSNQGHYYNQYDHNKYNSHGNHHHIHHVTYEHHDSDDNDGGDSSDVNKQPEDNTKPKFTTDGTTSKPVEVTKTPVPGSAEEPEEFSIDIRTGFDDDSKQT